MNNNILTKIQNYHDIDEHQKIIDLINQLNSDDLNYELTSLLARAYSNLGSFDKSISLLLSVREEGEYDDLWYSRLAHNNLLNEEFVIAKGLFLNALEINPKNQRVKELLSVCYYLIGKDLCDNNKCDEGLVELYNSLEHASCKVKIYLEIAEVFISLHQYEDALPCLKNVISVEPDNLLACINLAFVYYNCSKFNEALTFYEHAIELDSMVGYHYYNKGRCLFHLSRYEDAVDSYTSAIEIVPTVSDFYFEKGKALVLLNRNVESLICLEKAIEIDPTQISCYYLKSMAQYLLNRYEESLESLNTIIELDSNIFIVYVSKAEILIALEEYNKALECYDIAMSIDPYNETVADSREELLAIIED